MINDTKTLDMDGIVTGLKDEYNNSYPVFGDSRYVLDAEIKDYISKNPSLRERWRYGNKARIVICTSELPIDKSELFVFNVAVYHSSGVTLTDLKFKKSDIIKE